MPVLTVNLLIDAIVRQTVVLIAQLATASGVRTPLADVANEVFLGLVRELQAQGLRQKVIADMFGMALRTYYERVRRLSESATDRGKTLWEAVLGYVQQQTEASKGAVLQRFARDDEAMVRSVLNDLVDNGLLYRIGRGDFTRYRAADPAEIARRAASGDVDAAAVLVRIVVLRQSPASRQRIQEAVGLPDGELTAILDQLVADGTIARRAGDAGGIDYVCDACVIPYGDTTGWEAAVLDHYSAVIAAVVAKLQAGERTARARDATGGSTYRFDLWDGHPLEEEALGLLQRVREQATELRQRVDQHAAAAPPPPGARTIEITFYGGQSVVHRDRQGGAAE